MQQPSHGLQQEKRELPVASSCAGSEQKAHSSYRRSVLVRAAASGARCGPPLFLSTSFVRWHFHRPCASPGGSCSAPLWAAAVLEVKPGSPLGWRLAQGRSKVLSCPSAYLPCSGWRRCCRTRPNLQSAPEGLGKGCCCMQAPFLLRCFG